jgi:hypothetical protein
VQIFHVVGFERHGAVEQGEEDNTSTPEISLESLITLVFDDLRSNISGSTTVFSHDFILLYQFRDTEISDFDITFTVKEDVIQLDVSVNDVLGVDVA